MEFQAVFHRTTDNLCYALNEEDLIINLKTGYDVDKVFLHYGDPFSNGILGGSEKWNSNGRREEISIKKRLKYHIWWTTTVKPEFKRCRYYFELVSNGETWYYLENSFYKKEQMEQLAGEKQYFTFPWINPSDVVKTPEWVNQTVWYQIFPDRFCNGDNTINPKEVKPWASPNHRVSNKDIYGGDLQGIINRLDYLQDIGINGLYLTPINLSESSHKYDTEDYLAIDPAFGDQEMMKRMVKEAHQRGIRVMLDGVFNHCGRKFAPWMDVLEKGPESEYYDWFMINKWPFLKSGSNAKKGKFYTFAFYDGMPKLNTNHPKVIEYLLMICETWVKEYDIDGLRLDVANEVSHKFCKQLRIHMDSIKEDFYILGEIWHDSIPWLRGDEFDAVMNYPLGESISDFWLNQNQKKEEFEYAINRCYTMYMEQTNDVLFNLLDSHDTIRLINKVGNIDKVYQQLAVLFTMPGSPCIYYGTEVVLEGGHDPDCRRCMPWKEIEAGDYDSKIEQMKHLIALRRQEPIFRSRNFQFTNEIPVSRVVEYIKIDENGNKIEVLLNCSNQDITIEEKGRILFENQLDNNILKINGTVIRRINALQS